jgi:hypothetical protein
MTNFGVRSFMMVFLLVATGLGALVLGAMPADQGPPCEGSRHPLAPTASDGPLPSDVVEGTPSEHEHSVRNAGMLVTDHSPLWTEDFNDVWVRPGLYNHICATCRPHEPIEVTVTVENLGIYDEASVRVDLSATDASGRASASASRTLSVTAGDKVDVDLGLKLNRAGFYVLTTNVTAALDEVADDNLANSSVLVDKWIDDLEGDITGWDAGGAWAVGSKSGASHSPTHYWHFERSPGTTTGDELVSPVIDLRLYDRSAKLPPNLAQGGINYCIFFNMYFQGRLYGTGQDSIDLLMRASNTTTWTSLVKYDGNTQVGGGTPPGDFSSEWFRYHRLHARREERPTLVHQEDP